MSDASRVVEAFVAAFNARDLDAIMGMFDPDAVYHNMPVKPVEGLEGIRATIQGFMGMASEVDWVVHEIAESASGAVLTERTDRFLMKEKWVELPVMGTFVVRDGRITAWRDYFDMQQFTSQLPG